MLRLRIAVCLILLIGLIIALHPAVAGVQQEPTPQTINTISGFTSAHAGEGGNPPPARPLEQTSPLWAAQGRLDGASLAVRELSGYAAAVSRNTAVVGVPQKDGHTGAAYVFTRSSSSWLLTHPLLTTTSVRWWR
jgi:hypothetical protein